jgi:hypothetical protein
MNPVHPVAGHVRLARPRPHERRGRSPDPLLAASCYRRGAAALAALLACACSSASPTAVQPVPENALRVLFIGNSLTYANDLPAMLKTLADSASVDRPLHVDAVAFADFSLEDHWADGRARRALNDGSWDVVIMQQGPSTLPQNRVHLASWSERWADAIRENGGRPALYMVWAQASGDLAAVSESYRAAAEHVNGMLLPAGEAWRAAFRRDAAVPLYAGDNFHPSVDGTYLAAVVMLGILYDVDVTTAASSFDMPGATIRLDEARAELLRASAAEANDGFGRR